MMLEEHLFKSESFVTLIDKAVSFLINSPEKQLPPSEPFAGGGVYALYYHGNFPKYQPIYKNRPNTPIYVGKSVLPGWRQGRASINKNTPALLQRLREHARNINAVQNLETKDFLCRFIILRNQEADLISTVEAALTRKYNPLWNSHINGFGNHDPGKGRYNQAKSEWDVLHPGRAWAERLTGNTPDVRIIEEKLGAYNAIE